LALPEPYRAGAQPFADASELQLVQGFGARAYAKLRPWVTALPVTAGATAVNINTAPAAVLAALFPAAGAGAVQALVAQRTHNPFTSVAQLQTLLPGAAGAAAAPYGIRSNYFEVLVQAHFGRITERTQALLYRPLSQPATILWASRYWAS
ncbi:MAG TPA: type II secretion system protein GspK, partial [Acidiferrobacteraceae bacterium]|nr:type II secretion system protein GspK [Acidiferrobacteraceae bacterium]